MNQLKAFRLLTVCFPLCLFSQWLSAKNVVFILADDLSERLTCYGGPVVSPNLDRLAESGTLFENANVQATICTPSRASIMTGMRPDQVGTRDNNYAKSNFRNFQPDTQTLPQYLQQFGYSSIGLGKIYGPPDPASWSREVFEVSDGASQYALEENSAIFSANYAKYNGWKGGWRNMGPLTENADVSDSAYPDGMVTDRAVELIYELQGQAFFLYVGFQRPHRPFSAPKQYWDLYANETLPFPEPGGVPLGVPEMAIKGHRKSAPRPGDAKYQSEYEQMIGHYAATSYLDALVGKIIKALEETGLEEETLIVFSADHGFHVGDNGQWDKFTLFDATCSVPMIIRVPGAGNGPSVINETVELIDIYPTVLDFLGLPHPPQLAGKSLLPSLVDASVPAKDYAFTEVVRNQAGKLNAGNWDGTFEGRSIRVGDYRLNRWWNTKTGEIVGLELYDYSIPLPESRNLIDTPEYTKVQASLLSELENQWPLKSSNKD